MCFGQFKFKFKKKKNKNKNAHKTSTRVIQDRSPVIRFPLRKFTTCQVLNHTGQLPSPQQTRAGDGNFILYYITYWIFIGLWPVFSRKGTYKTREGKREKGKKNLMAIWKVFVFSIFLWSIFLNIRAEASIEQGIHSSDSSDSSLVVELEQLKSKISDLGQSDAHSFRFR